MMPWRLSYIILVDFDLSLSIATRTNKIITPPINLQPCSTPHKNKVVVVMEGLN